MVGEKSRLSNLRHRQLCGLQKTQRTSGQMEKEELMSTERMINNLESDGSFKDNGRQRKMSDKQ